VSDKIKYVGRYMFELVPKDNRVNIYELCDGKYILKQINILCKRWDKIEQFEEILEYHTRLYCEDEDTEYQDFKKRGVR